MVDPDRLRMTGASRTSHWAHAPSSLTDVCAVTDPTTPRAVIDALGRRFGSTLQFGLLILLAPDSLHSEWVTSFAASPSRKARPKTTIERLLGALPPDCLLALCSQSIPAIHWLGSVLGHRCRITVLNPFMDAAWQTDAAIEGVYSALSAALANHFGDDF